MSTGWWRRIAATGVALVFFSLAATAQAANRVFWGDEGSATISFANMDGSGGGGSVSSAGVSPAPVSPSGTVIDTVNGYVYWADESNNDIAFAALNGSASGVLNTTGAAVDVPEGLAINPATGMLYWANDSGSVPISFASVTGSGGGNLNVTGATADGPSGIAIDPALGKVYWGNYSNSTISFANLDNSGGGGQLNLTGATPDGPAGVTIDSATGTIYWTNWNNGTISYASLSGGGGGQLPTTGTTLSNPYGLALDPVGGKLYIGNYSGAQIAVANLNGSGASTLNAAPVVPQKPDFPALLEVPLATGAPAITGGTAVGSRLTCSAGSWASDLPESALFRAPENFLYSWTLNGSAVGGPTNTITALGPGNYVCNVVAVNPAGTTTQSSSGFTVVTPPQQTTVTFGNQTIKVTLPGACTASSGKLAATLSSVRRSAGTKLKFSSAAFYIGKGVKHVRHTKKGRKRITVITYTPNAIKHSLPATVNLSLAGLKSGTHTLTVKVFYKKTVKRHGRRATVTVSKTIRVKFSVC
jgi:DNA-binding beta-propeller fold protein YncE